MPSIRKSLKNKRSQRSKSLKNKRSQKGGVGFTFNLKSNCRIGGLPERNTTSDCPSGSIFDPCNIKKAYGQTCSSQNGGKRNYKKNMKKNQKSKSNKVRKNKSYKVQKNQKKKKSSKK